MLGLDNGGKTTLLGNLNGGNDTQGQGSVDIFVSFFRIN
jgi:GTPase SAR1 family protein